MVTWNGQSYFHPLGWAFYMAISDYLAIQLKKSKMATGTASPNYQMGLLYLSHILISADGVIHEEEQKALIRFKEEEKIPQSVYDEFQRDVQSKKLSAIYQRGLDMINECTVEEKKKAFTHLFKLCAVDGSIHPKEVKLLLYSARLTDSDLNDIMAASNVKG